MAGSSAASRTAAVTDLLSDLPVRDRTSFSRLERAGDKGGAAGPVSVSVARPTLYVPLKDTAPPPSQVIVGHKNVDLLIQGIEQQKRAHAAGRNKRTLDAAGFSSDCGASAGGAKRPGRLPQSPSSSANDMDTDG